MERDTASSTKLSWLLWTGIAASILVYGLVPIGDRQINLSLFDLVLPLVALAVLIARRHDAASLVAAVAGLRECRLSILALGLIAAHVAVVSLGTIDVSLPGFLRETTKTAGFFGQFLLLALIFRGTSVALPSPAAFTLLIGAACGVAIVRHFQELYAPGSWFLPRNLHLALLGTLLFAQYLSARERATWTSDAATDRLWLILAHLLCVTVAFVLLSKTYLAIFALAVPFLWVRSSRKVVPIAAGVLFLVAIATILGFDHLVGIDAFRRLDSVAYSLGYRGTLWKVSLEAGWQSFPWGIGLGQIAGVLNQLPDLHNADKALFAHNVFIAHFAEMGALGLLLMAVLLGLVGSVLRHLSIGLAAAASLLLFVPMLLQDALGLRALAVLLALILVHGQRRHSSIHS